MDFISWLQENDIAFSLNEIESGWLFQLHDVTASDGITVIKTPCNFGRTARTAVGLFIISYDKFFLCRDGLKPLFIDSDILECKAVPNE